MKSYYVTFSVFGGSMGVPIQAENEDEAVSKATESVKDLPAIFKNVKEE